MSCRIISIEGNIGSGKSTLVDELKQRIKDPHVVFCQEPVDVWNDIKETNTGTTILSRFYEDPTTYAFAFQMMAYISRISMLRKLIKDNPGAIIITERSVETDRNVFAKMLRDQKHINELQYKIYLQWFDEFSEDTKVSSVIYVKTSTNRCVERILKRNREGESIHKSYLEECSQYHDNWLKNCNNVLSLNGDVQLDDNVANEWVRTIQQHIEEQKILHVV